MPEGCLVCDLAAGRRSPPGGILARRAGFIVHPACAPEPVAGWMVVAPERHVEGWDGLDGEEAGRLGALIARAMAAVRVVTGAPKVYVAVFGEQVPHLHVHLFPRGHSVPPEDRGPRLLFDRAPRAAAAEAERVAREIVARFEGG